MILLRDGNSSFPGEEREKGVDKDWPTKHHWQEGNQRRGRGLSGLKYDGKSDEVKKEPLEKWRHKLLRTVVIILSPRLAPGKNSLPSCD